MGSTLRKGRFELFFANHHTLSLYGDRLSTRWRAIRQPLLSPCTITLSLQHASNIGSLFCCTLNIFHTSSLAKYISRVRWVFAAQPCSASSHQIGVGIHHFVG
jgi:hypothetical protein